MRATVAAGLRSVGRMAGATPQDARREQAPTQHQLGVQARVIARLKRDGVIDAMTVQKMGTTDARKMFTRLREKGLLYPANDPVGYEDRPNKSGQGKYRVHFWTGQE